MFSKPSDAVYCAVQSDWRFCASVKAPVSYLLIIMEKALETYLHTHIPISEAMGITVEHASLQKVVLSAPFANNINHKKTVFGGSLHAVATLACWSLVHLHAQKRSQKKLQIVITHSDLTYHAPVDADFRAECMAPDDTVWQRFFKMLHAKGKARITLTCKIFHANHLAVEYQGTFAAICMQ